MRWILFIIFYILIDIYAFQAVRTLTRNSWIHGVYVLLSILILAALIYQISNMGAGKVMDINTMYVFGIFLTFFVPKLIIVVFMFGEDMGRFFTGIFMKVAGSDEAQFMASRRKFVSTIALGIAAIPFASLLYGMIQGKYNYKVLKNVLEFEDLHGEFEGFT